MRRISCSWTIWALGVASLVTLPACGGDSSGGLVDLRGRGRDVVGDREHRER